MSGMEKPPGLSSFLYTLASPSLPKLTGPLTTSPKALFTLFKAVNPSVSQLSNGLTAGKSLSLFFKV